MFLGGIQRGSFWGVWKFEVVVERMKRESGGLNGEGRGFLKGENGGGGGGGRKCLPTKLGLKLEEVWRKYPRSKKKIS